MAPRILLEGTRSAGNAPAWTAAQDPGPKAAPHAASQASPLAPACRAEVSRTDSPCGTDIKRHHIRKRGAKDPTDHSTSKKQPASYKTTAVRMQETDFVKPRRADLEFGEPSVFVVCPEEENTRKFQIPSNLSSSIVQECVFPAATHEVQEYYDWENRLNEKAERISR